MLKNEEKNLHNIQRIDSFAKEIILHCTQAALYEFNLDDNKWKNTETMGPLFVYRRENYPFYAIVIANRQSLSDYVEPIMDSLSLKYDPPYILIHRNDGSIRGIWIYGEDECKRIFEKMTELMDGLPECNDEQSTDELAKNLKEILMSAGKINQMGSSNDFRQLASSGVDTNIVTHQQATPIQARPSSHLENSHTKSQQRSGGGAGTRQKQPTAAAIGGAAGEEKKVMSSSSVAQAHRQQPRPVGQTKTSNDSANAIEVQKTKENEDDLQKPVPLITKLLNMSTPMLSTAGNSNNPTSNDSDGNATIERIIEATKCAADRDAANFITMREKKNSNAAPAMTNSSKQNAPAMGSTVTAQSSMTAATTALAVANRNEQQQSIGAPRNSSSPKEKWSPPFENVADEEETTIKKQQQMTKMITALSNQNKVLRKIVLCHAKRIDVFAEEVIEFSEHVVLYNFCTKENKWIMTDTQGALVVFKRFDYPFHSMLIFDSKNTNDQIVQPLGENIKIEFKPPYLFFAGGESINGIWFTTPDECKRVYGKLAKLVAVIDQTEYVIE